MWGYDSSVDRAQKYFTGGFGLKGSYDKGWGKKEVEGHGILWHYKHGDTALAYWYLGHAAHLLEDATVPAHVLLYPHPLKNADRYETYMGAHYAVRVFAVDAAGNRAVSAAGYLTAAPAPAVASAR